MREPETDFAVSGHWTIYSLRPISEDAQAWVEENLQGDDVTWFGGAVVVEHRFINPIIEGILRDGLTISKE